MKEDGLRYKYLLVPLRVSLWLYYFAFLIYCFGGAHKGA